MLLSRPSVPVKHIRMGRRGAGGKQERKNFKGMMKERSEERDPKGAGEH